MLCYVNRCNHLKFTCMGFDCSLSFNAHMRTLPLLNSLACPQTYLSVVVLCLEVVFKLGFLCHGLIRIHLRSKRMERQGASLCSSLCNCYMKMSKSVFNLIDYISLISQLLVGDNIPMSFMNVISIFSVLFFLAVGSFNM